MYSFQKKSKTPWISITLAGIFCVVFLLDYLLLSGNVPQAYTLSRILLGGEGGNLTQLLSLQYTAVMQGEVWRVVTSMFLHGGVLHLASNCALLLVLGHLLETTIGRIKFLVIFLLSGILCAVCILRIWQIDGGLGASTAIYGLLAAFTVQMLRDPKSLSNRVTPLHWLVIAAAGVSNVFMDPITITEHLAGYVCGMLVCLLFVAISRYKSLTLDPGW